ncbi:hypothetical protein ACLB2K_058314 [Fragaria x ananassa]
MAAQNKEAASHDGDVSWMQLHLTAATAMMFLFHVLPATVKEIVVRNHLGDLVLAGGERVQGRFRPSVVELLALCKGLKYVVEHNWLLEKVECDCLEAVRVVNDVGECFSEEGILVDRVRVLLVAVDSPKLSHVSRTANGAADVVAKYVARLNGRLVWLGVGPDWLMDVIVSDGPVTVSGSREMSGETSSSTDNSHVL